MKTIQTQHTDIFDVDAWSLFYEHGTTKFMVVDVQCTVWFPVFIVDEILQPCDFIGWNNSPIDGIPRSAFI